MTRGIVTFSFDDGCDGWLLAADILEKYGFKGTFNVAIRHVRKRHDNLVIFPTDRTIHEEDLVELQKRGHEIGSHSLRHVNLRRCNKVEVRHELRTSKEILESHGLKIKTFTCPFNAYTNKIREEALKHYDSFRGSIGVNRLPFKGNCYKVFHGSPLKECKVAVTSAEKSDMWVVLLFHNVKRDNTDPYSFDADEFENLVKFTSKSKVAVKKVSEVIG